jgi:DNA-binding NtrC family response regulator
MKISNYLDMNWQIPVRGDWRLSTHSHNQDQEPRTPVSGHDSKAEFTEQPAGRSLIFIVDDEPRLTELYALILEAAGFPVKSFNDRSDALVALDAATNWPRLLILDYFGHPMSAERFIERFRQVHPSVRILMASGLNAFQWRSQGAGPDHFIQKPFTTKSFLAAVRFAIR